MPNTVSTPAASSERTKLCAPLICSDIGTLSGRCEEQKTPRPGWAHEGLRARLGISRRAARLRRGRAWAHADVLCHGLSTHWAPCLAIRTRSGRAQNGAIRPTGPPRLDDPAARSAESAG